MVRSITLFLVVVIAAFLVGINLVKVAPSIDTRIKHVGLIIQRPTIEIAKGSADTVPHSPSDLQRLPAQVAQPREGSLRVLVQYKKPEPLPQQSDDASTMPCGDGINRGKPSLCKCAGVSDAIVCLTFTGDCDSPMKVDCEHMRQRVNSTNSAAAVVVTAFWNLRPDIKMQDWQKWLAQVHDLDAELVSFVPASLAPELRQRRAARGQQHRTCVIEMEATQLPYAYLLPAAEAMLKRLVATKPADYAGWNWKSPEMTNSHYVLLQAGKLPVLDAVRQLGISRGRPLIWIDAGLGRHVNLQGSQLWPSREQLAQLDDKRIYLSSRPGYGPMRGELGTFCAEPRAQFVRNRNHLAGTTMVVSESALAAIFPVWTFMLEQMVAETRWNNDQVMWELLMCFFPDKFGVLDSARTLFAELRKGFGSISKLDLPQQQGGPQAFCRHWGAINAAVSTRTVPKTSQTVPVPIETVPIRTLTGPIRALEGPIGTVPVPLQVESSTRSLAVVEGTGKDSPRQLSAHVQDRAKQKHLCLNADYAPTHDFAVWTFLTLELDAGYLRGAMMLSKSVRKHSTQPLDLVVMQLQGPKQLDAKTQAALRAEGWKICTVQRIVPLNEGGTYYRFRDQFTKLHMWGMTQYKGVLYMDADTFVMGSIDELFSETYLGPMRARGSGVTATPDIWQKRVQENFNMGVFLAVPNATEHSRLVALQKSNTVKFEVGFSEQGFLNVVYKAGSDQRHTLPFKFNANFAAYVDLRPFWDKERPDIRIMHYTLEKPWACTPQSRLYSICKWWIDAEKSLSLVRSVSEHRLGPDNHDATSQVPFPKPKPEQSAAAQGRKHLCLNADYAPTHDFAVWTFLTLELDAGYLRGALNMGRSVRKHSTQPLDLVVMQLQGPKQLDAKTQAALRAEGWKICTVQRIPPKNEAATLPIFRDQFTKLHMWGMTQYKGVLYMDADTLAVGKIDELFSETYLGPMRARGSGIATARDVMHGRIQENFNMGVFLVVPNAAEYSRLLAVQKSDVKFEFRFAEQGFLNAVYRSFDQRQDLPFKFNANIAAFLTMKPFWDKEKADIRIVHYTDAPKPWACKPSMPIYSLCEWWIKAERETSGIAQSNAVAR